jgi:hypothetical protein
MSGNAINFSAKIEIILFQWKNFRFVFDFAQKKKASVSEGFQYITVGV